MQIALDTPGKKRALVFGLLVLSAGYFAAVSLQFSAEWLASRPSLSSVRLATRLDPGNAEFHDRLARLDDLAFHDARSAAEQLRMAVYLNPYDAHYWLRLSDAYQVLGDVRAQEEAVERAISADPTTPDVAWVAANQFLAQGKTDKALQEFHIVMTGAPNMVNMVLVMCFRADPNPDVVLREVLPPYPGSYFSLLERLMSKEDTEATTRVWDGLVSLHQPIELPPVFNYIKYLLLHKEPEEATAVWRETASLMGLNSYLPSSNNLIVNGDFSLDVLNGGFDWQYKKQPSVSLILDTSDFHAGHRSLAIGFDGPGVNDAGIFQIIAVRPNTTYQFSGYYRNGEIEGAGGPHFALQDLYSSNVYYLSNELKYGSSWRNEFGEFTTGPDTRMLALYVTRVPAGAAIRGKLWIDDFRLVEKQPAEARF